MKKNYIYTLIIIFITILIFKNTHIVVLSVNKAFNIWKNNLFPSLFPMMVIGSILINLGLNINNKYINKILKINGNMSTILFLSMFTGFPSSAKYIKESLLNNEIDDMEATKLLTFTHFSNPLFIINSIPLFLNNKSIGIKILICHYITNFIIAFIFRNYYYKDKSIILKKKNKPISLIISESISSSINIIIYILGTLCIYLIINNLLNNTLNIPDILKCILNGIIEMSSGINNISNLNITIKYKAMLSLMFISFGGIVVHTQVLGIISDTKIKYYPYFIARILHMIISVLLYFIFF